jgi:hypothetical protein
LFPVSPPVVGVGGPPDEAGEQATISTRERGSGARSIDGVIGELLATDPGFYEPESHPPPQTPADARRAGVVKKFRGRGQ